MGRPLVKTLPDDCKIEYQYDPYDPYDPYDQYGRLVEVDDGEWPLKPIEVNSGEAIPWFGQEGLGIQYELPKNINLLLREGYIKKVDPIKSKGEL